MGDSDPNGPPKAPFWRPWDHTEAAQSEESTSAEASVTPSPGGPHSSSSAPSRQLSHQTSTGSLAGAPATQPGTISCANCGITNSSLWRRSKAKQLVCNPCGLYERYAGARSPSDWGKRACAHARTKDSPSLLCPRKRAFALRSLPASTPRKEM